MPRKPLERMGRMLLSVRLPMSHDQPHVRKPTSASKSEATNRSTEPAGLQLAMAMGQPETKASRTCPFQAKP